MDDIDRRILQFEHRYYRHAGRREADIQTEIGISPTRYAQRLSYLLRDPEAWLSDPLVMKRLRRIVDRKRVA